MVNNFKQVLEVLIVDNEEWPVGFKPTKEDQKMLIDHPLEAMKGFIGTLTAALITIIRASSSIGLSDAKLFKESLEIIKGGPVTLKGNNLIRIEINTVTGIDIIKDQNETKGKTSQEVTELDIKQLAKGIEIWIRVIESNKLAEKEALIKTVTYVLEQGFIDPEIEITGAYLMK